MKQKYPFLIRLFVGFPIMILLGIWWAIIMVFSIETLGQIMKRTGEKLLTKH